VKVSVITNENICRVNEELLKLVREAAKPMGDVIAPVLVIVPDRFTLQAEKILLQGAKCLLNVRVLTFSMLYNLIHEELMGTEESLKVLSKTTAVLCMWRAIQMVRRELRFFSRSVDQYAFAEKMFNTINQLTSCMADFKNLEKNAAGDVTGAKMHDIQIIYAKYKELTKEYTDSAGMLGWLIDNVGSSRIVKDTNVFITGFEHLSVQRAEVVRGLVRHAGSFTAGVRTGSEFEGWLCEVRFAM